MAGLVVLLLGVLVPFSVRSRIVLADSRLDDRTSSRMHVVAVGGTAHGEVKNRRGQCSSGAHARRTRRKAVLVPRPADLRQASAADARALAVARAHLAARQSRRAAGRRRRTVLNLALVILTVTVFTLGLVTALSVWWTLVPATLTAASLVASRRADLAAQARDRHDRTELDAIEERLQLTAARLENQREERRRQVRAVREARALATAQQAQQIDAAPAVVEEAQDVPVEAAEQIVEAEPVEDEQAVATPAAGVTEPLIEQRATWTPAAVPAPVYTLKAAARRAVDPYEAQPHGSTASVPMRPVATTTVGAPMGTELHAAQAERAPYEEPAQTIDLASVLERRRAKGA